MQSSPGRRPGPARPGVLAAGRIESIEGGVVRGWVMATTEHVRPALLVGGVPARLVAWPVARSDASESTPSSRAWGFEFRGDAIRAGDTAELLVLSVGGVQSVDTAIATDSVLTTSFFDQLQAVQAIAAQPDAVAITCWESSHNPIGRARVLHDVLRDKRPVAVLAYAFEEFGDGLWPPVRDSDLTLLTIPWWERHAYHDVLRSSGLAFETVWLCKPRLPTFVLAGAVAHRDARLILDLDDNEEHFAQSEASFAKPYGFSGIGFTRALVDRLEARTVASASLQQRYGGTLLRHAREPGVETTKPQPREGRPFRVGFVGTVRPHKNLLAAARAITVARLLTGRDIELHVRGDVVPPDYAEELRANGAVVGGLVSSGELPSVLAELDCVLTGFPHDDPDHEAGTRYQISSKIGDALAAGIPVLVPREASVADLDSVPGISLFDVHEFAEKLEAAMTSTGVTPSLPVEFTLDGAYESFVAAERRSATAPRASAVLGSLFLDRGPSSATDPAPPATDPPSLLLLWKQQDAGLYGRRVDQVARAHRRAHPGARVVVLEMLPDHRERFLESHRTNWLSDASLTLALLRKKTQGGFVDADGVEYHCLRPQARVSTSSALESFLVSQGLTPDRTCVVLYPVVPFFGEIRDVLRPYRKVVDVVDNQFSWGSSPSGALDCAEDYTLSLLQADPACFNSSVNAQHFADLGILPPGHEARVIPNWYAMPADFRPSPDGALPDGPHVVYSGNMSDRVDWGLVKRLAAHPLRPWVHLVGSALRVRPALLRRVLSQDRLVYHGPLNEVDTLALLARATVGILPHEHDQVSRFMNPLKVSMYRAVGLPVVATQVPGVNEEHVVLARTHREFTESVAGFLRNPERLPPSGPASSREEYLRMLHPPGTSTPRPVPSQVRSVAHLLRSQAGRMLPER